MAQSSISHLNGANRKDVEMQCTSEKETSRSDEEGEQNAANQLSAKSALLRCESIDDAEEEDEDASVDRSGSNNSSFGPNSQGTSA